MLKKHEFPRIVWLISRTEGLVTTVGVTQTDIVVGGFHIDVKGALVHENTISSVVHINF